MGCNIEEFSKALQVTAKRCYQSHRLTFGPWGKHRSLDSICLEAPLKRVIPQSDYAILPTSHKPLSVGTMKTIILCYTTTKT